MKTFQTLILLLVLCMVVTSIVSKKTTKATKKASASSKKHKKSVNPFKQLFTNASQNNETPTLSFGRSKVPVKPVVMSKRDYNAAAQEAQSVDQIYAQNPSGIHKFEQAQRFEFFVKIQDSIQTAVRPFGKEVVFLNNLGTLFYVRVENDIRQVVNSINLMDIVNIGAGADNIIEGECCSAISSITKTVSIEQADNGQSRYMNSFQISAGYLTWTFADYDYATLYRFRQVIRMMIVRIFYQQQNYVIPSFVNDAIDDMTTAFSWDTQEKWQGECNTGRYQSPIAFTKKAVHYLEGHRLNFYWRPTERVRARANSGQNEIELIGDFGSLEFINASGEHQDFVITKVTMKFPAEHVINGIQMSGEVLVYHQGHDGSLAIVSFLLQRVGDMNYDTSGAFWRMLQSENWSPANSNYEVIIKDKLNLSKLYGSGQMPNKSFYMYKGSDTVPPCEEAVYRFVMEQPIKVADEVLSDMKSRSVAQGYSLHSRTPHKFTDAIFYQIDTDFICPEISSTITSQVRAKQAVLRDEINKIFEDQTSKMRMNQVKVSDDNEDADDSDDDSDDDDEEEEEDKSFRFKQRSHHKRHHRHHKN